MNKIFFDSWESIFRTLIITVIAYAILIIFLRLSGKRTLSKMNAFDFVVTIALGSTLATVMLNKSVALLDGVLALFLLVGLQYIITFMAVRSEKFSKMVKSTPVLLVYSGSFLEKAMRSERVNHDEIFAALREKGYSSVKEVDAIILETDGSLTIIRNVADEKSPVITSVKRID